MRSVTRTVIPGLDAPDGGALGWKLRPFLLKTFTRDECRNYLANSGYTFE